jgi:hypothetical protein
MGIVGNRKIISPQLSRSRRKLKISLARDPLIANKTMKPQVIKMIHWPRWLSNSSLTHLEDPLLCLQVAITIRQSYRIT